jgi:hypothetical protein
MDRMARRSGSFCGNADRSDVMIGSIQLDGFSGFFFSSGFLGVELLHARGILAIDHGTRQAVPNFWMHARIARPAGVIL